MKNKQRQNGLKIGNESCNRMNKNKRKKIIRRLKE